MTQVRFLVLIVLRKNVSIAPELKTDLFYDLKRLLIDFLFGVLARLSNGC